jgi:ribonuclease HII
MSNCPTYEREAELAAQGFNYVVGVDEAGRGSAVGPVVAGAVRIPYSAVEKLYGLVKDSKKLSEKKRNTCYDLILDCCDCSVFAVSNEVIDQINILEATKLAMVEAVKRIPFTPEYVLIDGDFKTDDILKNGIPNEQIIKGDVSVLSIAAASIMAKVYRDKILYKLDKTVPIYDWAHNKGYLTKKHREAIALYGASVFHRKSYKLL